MTVYFGAWENDKRAGYGVFEDTVRQVCCLHSTYRSCVGGVWEGRGRGVRGVWELCGRGILLHYFCTDFSVHDVYK